ncbi:hypothetical protein ACH5RR_026599 [Cinchona calisaya]|uniref:Myb-like domain-containing protein n=1 Tax=Cinchona calisaya TaxID=153742 RepID=A0ABD2Z317_9GENT
MMLGTSSSSGGGLIGGNSAEAGAGAAAMRANTIQVLEAATHDSTGSGEVGGAAEGAIPSEFISEVDDKGRIEEGERGGGGNRWPRQETLALLKLRSEMDVVFRDSSLKGPLWEEVSRKMAELGYERSSKKCKEKFENVYKYHKRTKEGRASKADGKNYRFFDQLEALETNPSMQSHPPHRPQPSMAAASTMATSNPPISSSAPLSPNPVSFAQNFLAQNVGNINNSVSIPVIPSIPHSQSQPLPPPPPPPPSTKVTNPHMNISASMLSNSSSSSTSSDEEIGRRHSRKRKWKDFFDRLMKNVIDKQEEMQKKFLDTLEKRERDRMKREEAWRVQEMAKMNREHDLLIQERSMTAAKDAAVIAFLQKIAEQQNQQNPNNAIQIPVQLQLPVNPPPPAPAPAQPIASPPLISVSSNPQAAVQIPAPAPTRNMESVNPDNKTDNGIQNSTQTGSSRWPKAEIEALISLRTNLDVKYHENGPKGPLWEEISAGMRKLGYNRNAKRCKEKWENINKYFKKVKESNKKRPEDSKTCPYFQQLDALYKEKAKTTDGINPMVPIMARPEQQWPSLQPQQPEQQNSAMEEEQGSENMDENDHDEEEDDEEEDDGGGYEMVTNKQASASVATTAA